MPRRDRTGASPETDTTTAGDATAISLEDALNTTLISLVKPDKAPNWIDISSKIYRICRIWYSPQSLEAHYYLLLKSHESSSSSSATTTTGRGKAEKQAIFVANAVKTNSLYSSDTGGGATSNIKQEVAHHHHASSSIATAAAAHVKQESTYSSSSSVKQEPTTSHHDHNQQNQNQNVQQQNQNQTSSSSTSILPQNIKSSSCHSLESLWNVELPLEILHELVNTMEALDTQKIFSMNVGPRVLVHVSSNPVGKHYCDVVFHPNSLLPIREKISTLGTIKTLSQLYLELSLMTANCVMFNLPGGWFPHEARHYQVRVLNAWAEFLAKCDINL